MKKLIGLLLLGGTVFASTNVKSLDIYTNKSFINQKLQLNKKSIDLIGMVRLEDIKFMMNPSCSINSFDVDSKNYEDDDLTKDIENLEKSINNKENQIKALKSNISFLEKSNITNLQNISILEKTSAYLKKQILEDYSEIFAIENSLKKEKELLDNLNRKRTDNKFTKLTYDINCKSEVLVSYPINNIQKKALYDINYDSKTKKLELENLLFITPSFGEDLKDIEINLYTFNYINQIKPNRFIPEYLDIANNEVAYAQMVSDVKPLAKSTRVLNAPVYEYLEDTTKSFFKASHINLTSGKENKVIFAKDIYNAKDSLEIDGYSMSQPFYKVDFKSNKLYGVTNANLYLDGTYIGKTRLDEIKKDKDTSIYFSTNRFIDIDKKLLKDMKEEPFFSLNKIKTEKVWEYKIQNNSKVNQKIVLLERVPVSKHEDIKVTLIGKSKETKIEKDGKIYFEFDLKANESKTINFGYEIEKPTKK